MIIISHSFPTVRIDRTSNTRRVSSWFVVSRNREINVVRTLLSSERDNEDRCGYYVAIYYGASFVGRTIGARETLNVSRKFINETLVVRDISSCVSLILSSHGMFLST